MVFLLKNITLLCEKQIRFSWTVDRNYAGREGRKEGGREAGREGKREGGQEAKGERENLHRVKCTGLNLQFNEF